MAIDLLQQVGLTKYEAEAYYALLREGALTGYELGKRSAVPLSRSYEVLERLSQKGLALVQPGDPPRYRADDPDRLVEQVRNTLNSTLDALSGELRSLSLADVGEDFWVVRNRRPILARVRAMIHGAVSSIGLVVPPSHDDELDAIVAQSEVRRRQDLSVAIAAGSVPDTLVVLTDRQDTLVGRLTPEDRCQAVVSSSRALVHVVDGYMASRRVAEQSARASGFVTSDPPAVRSWLAWDEDKQRRLLDLTSRRDVA